MDHKCDLLRCTMIVSLSWGISSVLAVPAQRAAIEQTLETIQKCIARSPAPWPDEWKKEYIDTVRAAIQLHEDVPHYAERVEILAKGFGPYWASFEKSGDRSLFEVHRARVRWYIEHLMGTKFPTEEERERLRDQYTEIWDHAASSLLAQFPFLDPNAVQAAKADDLQQCYRKIDAPLIPVYLRPFSEEQVVQIKHRWDDLRYARVDLWRRLGGASERPSEKSPAWSNTRRDCELTKQSLSQLLGQVWVVVPQRPDYYLRALEDQANAAKRIVQSKREARSRQQGLEKERSRQVLQTEHVSFLLAALLETSQCPEGIPSPVTQEQNPIDQQQEPTKGGGVYEISKYLEEK